MPQTLLFPVAPLPAESIVNLVLRAAAENSYETTQHILSLVDGFRGDPQALGTTMIGHEAQLAHVLGLPDGGPDLAPMMNYEIPDKAGSRMFAGTPLRRIHWNNRYRNVSPRSLRLTLHDKAVWSVKAISFDPLTKESLLSSCPECRQRLSLTRTRGLQFCDRCTTIDERGHVRGSVDLRDYPQPIIECDDGEALDFVASLVDPDPASPGKRIRLPSNSPFTNVEAGQLFELAIALASSLSGYVVSVPHGTRRPRSFASFELIKPRHLECAGRAMLSWPQGFFDLIEEGQRSDGAIKAHFGRISEVGAAYHIKNNGNVDRHIRKIVSDAVEYYMAETSCISERPRNSRSFLDKSRFISLGEACSENSLSYGKMLLHIHAAKLQPIRATAARVGPVVFSRSALEELLREEREFITGFRLRKRWALSSLSLELIEREGYLAPVNALSPRAPNTTYYSLAEVMSLEDNLEKIVPVAEPKEQFVTLHRTQLSSYMGTSDFCGQVLTLALKNKTKLYRRKSIDRTRFGSLLLSNVADLSDIRPSAGSWIEEPIDILTATEMLDLCPQTFRKLMKAGFIATPLTPQNLCDFDRMYIGFSELKSVVRQRYGANISTTPNKRNIRFPNLPEMVSHTGCGNIWLRLDIERWLESVDFD